MIPCSRRNASPFTSVDTYSRVQVCKLVGSFASLIRPAIAIAKSETSIRRTIFGFGWMSRLPLAVVNLDLGKKEIGIRKSNMVTTRIVESSEIQRTPTWVQQSQLVQ